MNIFTIFAILTLKWPWYDFGVILMTTDSLLECLENSGIQKHFIDIIIHNFHHFLALFVYILGFRGQWPLEVNRGQIQFISTS